eukprot:scaffold1518_cov331-Pavlova_lutheri.AAC.15
MDTPGWFHALSLADSLHGRVRVGITQQYSSLALLRVPHRGHGLLAVLGRVPCVHLCLRRAERHHLAAVEWRPVRALSFAVLGLWGVVPCVHAISMHLDVPSMRTTILLEVLMGAIYLGGAAIYTLRIPERWKPGWFDIAGHSHQIFHVAVVIAAQIVRVFVFLVAWRSDGGVHHQVRRQARGSILASCMCSCPCGSARCERGHHRIPQTRGTPLPHPSFAALATASDHGLPSQTRAATRDSTCVPFPRGPPRLRCEEGWVLVLHHIDLGVVHVSAQHVSWTVEVDQSCFGTEFRSVEVGFAHQRRGQTHELGRQRIGVGVVGARGPVVRRS